MCDCCPKCGSKRYVKNGFSRHGAQNYRCNDCGRQFCLDPQVEGISDETKKTIDKLLLERISLKGICRSAGVSESWLLKYISKIYSTVPNDLGVIFFSDDQEVELVRIEADELWSFVGSKANKQWVWLALESKTKQIIAFHIGGRGNKDAKKFWNKIPESYRLKAVFYTDDHAPYKNSIPKNRHFSSNKKGSTNFIERFNLTARQRISRLVRKSLSFSKKLENHIGAIKYFLFGYNKERLLNFLISKSLINFSICD